MNFYFRRIRLSLNDSYVGQSKISCTGGIVNEKLYNLIRYIIPDLRAFELLSNDTHRTIPSFHVSSGDL